MKTLPEKLRIKASMIQLGERIAWGSEAELMEQAADEIERLASELRITNTHISAQGLELARAERAANPFHGLYQDPEGKIPVTSAGQLVGRVEYGNGSVGVQFNAANRPTAMPCGDVPIEPGTWLEENTV